MAWILRHRIIIFIAGIIIITSFALIIFLLIGSNKISSDSLKETSNNSTYATTSVTQPTTGNNDQNLSHLDCTPPSDNRYYRTDRSLAVDSNNSLHLFVAIEYKGAYQSFDGGQSWQQTLQDFKWRNGCFPEPFKASFSPSDSQVIYLSTNGDGILKTSDSGKTWKKLFQDWMYNKSEDFTFDPTNDQIIYAATENVQGAANPSDNSPVTVGLVYKSINGGETWTELPTGLDVGVGNNGIIVSKKDPTHLLVFTLKVHFQPGGRQIDTSGQMGILESKDSGATWTGIHTIPTGYDATAYMAFSPLNTNHIYVTSFTAPGTPEVDYMSLDFGKTWQVSSTVMAYVFYDPFDAAGLHLFGINHQPNVNTANKFFESNDGGKTWSQTSKFPAEITDSGSNRTLISDIQWDPKSKNTLYASAASGYVWKSTDSGKTWKKILSYDTLPK